jgi:hypothetical protein
VVIGEVSVWEQECTHLIGKCGLTKSLAPGNPAWTFSNPPRVRVYRLNPTIIDTAMTVDPSLESDGSAEEWPLESPTET